MWSSSARSVTVELSSVNRKQAEISVNLPRELEMLETRIREAILEKVSRGRITARVTVHAGDGTTELARHVTGQVLRVDGGQLMA